MKFLAFAAPLLFVALVACMEPTGPIEVTFTIPCDGPPPFVMDTTGYNGLCPFLIPDGDTTKLITPGVVG